MSLVPAIRDALGRLRRRPSVVAVGVTIALIQVLVGLLAWIIGVSVAPLVPELVGVTVASVAVTITLPLLVSLYGPLRADGAAPDSLAGTARTAGSAIRTHGPSVFAGTVVAEGVALGLGTAGWAVVFVLSTAVRWVRYQVASPHPPFPMEPFLVQFAGFVIALTAARLAVRFADLAIVVRGVRPRHAWRSSLEVVRSAPGAVLGYGVVVGTVAAIPGVLASLVSGVTRSILRPMLRAPPPGVTVPGDSTPLSVSLAGDLAGVAVLVLLGGIALAAVAALHLSLYEQVVDARGSGLTGPHAGDVAPGNGPGPSTGREGGEYGHGRPAITAPSRSGVLLALLVLLAAVGAAGAVRAADPRPVTEPELPLPADPGAALDAAVENTASASRRVRLRGRNESTENGSWRLLHRAGVDYHDRQLYVYFYGEDGHEVGAYHAEGALAMKNSGGRGGVLSGNAENWVLLPLPGYIVAARGGNVGSFPATDLPWKVVRANDSSLVLRVDRGPLVRSAFDPYDLRGIGPDQHPDSYVRVVVDRRRGVLDRVEAHLHSRETGRAFSYVVEYTDVGTADVRRPAPLGARRPLEWFWDVLYY